MISVSRRASRRMAVLILMIALALSLSTSPAYAAAGTVTLKYGGVTSYGGAGYTYLKWVTHIDGEAVDLDEVAGVSRSYAYCVQPTADPPPEGTHKVTIVDDDDTGRISKMRKFIYYLPGSYGYAKVTKKKWFSGCSVNEAYSLGHLGLSWIYDKYSDDVKVWGGASDSVVKKVKGLVDDLKNLPDPPEEYEIFWVKVSGKQDVFGAFYSTEYGKAKVKKTSAMPHITDGNVNYSIEGAQYTLYEDAECKTQAKTSSGGKAVITIKADGDSDPIEVETGQYYMKETKAPKGYALDTDVHSIEVHKDKTTTYSATDVPRSSCVELLLQKADRETGQPRPQGGASLAEAEYTVSYYDAEVPAGQTGDALAPYVSGRAPAKIEGRDAVWVFRTDEEGRVKMNDPDGYLVQEKSAPLYRDSSGRPVLPFGIISVKETAEPKGYELDSRTYYAAITDSGQTETIAALAELTGTSSLKEQVIRGDLKFIKAAEGRKRMGGVLFRLTSLTTGESHVLVTDRNGVASTASGWNLHSKNTNEGRTAEDGVWFNGYGNEAGGAGTDDSKGALPYDTYKLEELRCEANEGYELFSDEVTIERPLVTVDLGTYDNEKTPVPVIETRARDDESGENKAVADSKVVIVDEISYSGVAAGKTYTMEGRLMDRESGEPLKDEGGNEVKGSTEFYAESKEGSIEVRFEMDASSLGGKEAVVFEYLKQDGELVAAHADINNKKQTVKLEEPPKPEIHTDARDGESGTGKAEADKDVWIIDTVEYKNLTPGVNYLLCGLLMDKETGQKLLDDSGGEIRASSEFTAQTESGSHEISFRFSGEKLAGKDAVVFEYLYLKETQEMVASHEDINSRKQTVRLTEVKEPPPPEKEKPKKKKSSPDTGDSAAQALYCLAAMAAALEMALLTLRRRNDRLKRGE